MCSKGPSNKNVLTTGKPFYGIMSLCMYQFFFFFSTVRDWNNLSPDLLSIVLLNGDLFLLYFHRAHLILAMSMCALLCVLCFGNEFNYIFYVKILYTACVLF